MKFPAEYLESADVIAVLVGQENSVEFVRRNAAEGEPEHELTRAQSAIDEQSAMIGRDKRAVPGAAAPEHGQTEHPRYVATRFPLHKRKARRAGRSIDIFPVRRYPSRMEAPDLASLRREYETAGLRRSDLHPDPLEQFSVWFGAAVEAALPEVNAIALATSTPDGKPSARIVLLKGFDQRGFIFFTNYHSQKGRELDANPQAAFTIFWVQQERQIRVAGSVEKTSREESLAYFHSRPRGSQLSAWVSKQSEVIDARRILDARLAELTERFGDGTIELPPHWGGYRIVPNEVEFWQGRANRLHDRFRYLRQRDDSWLLERLAP